MRKLNIYSCLFFYYFVIIYRRNCRPPIAARTFPSTKINLILRIKIKQLTRSNWNETLGVLQNIGRLAAIHSVAPFGIRWFVGGHVCRDCADRFPRPPADTKNCPVVWTNIEQLVLFFHCKNPWNIGSFLADDLCMYMWELPGSEI